MKAISNYQIIHILNRYHFCKIKIMTIFVYCTSILNIFYKKKLTKTQLSVYICKWFANITWLFTLFFYLVTIKIEVFLVFWVCIFRGLLSFSFLAIRSMYFKCSHTSTDIYTHTLTNLELYRVLQVPSLLDIDYPVLPNYFIFLK